MKKFLIALAFVVTAAAQLTVGPKLKYNAITWTNPPGTTGNILYLGMTSGNYSQSINMPTNTTTYDLRNIGLSPNVYFLTVSCLNAQGNESAPGTEVRWDSTIPSAPVSVSLTRINP